MFYRKATFSHFMAKSMQPFLPVHLYTVLDDLKDKKTVLHDTVVALFGRAWEGQTTRCPARPISNSWCSQQHFLFLPKVDRVTLTLSPLEAT